MLNNYYAQLLDITDDNTIVLYGYTFRDKNMREAKLHALDVCRKRSFVTLPNVWRINHADYARLSGKYAEPTMLEIRTEEEECA